jgi:antitoxin component YwqK of YwqJK toxin-antitoxin module
MMSQSIYSKDILLEEKEWYENGQLRCIINYKDDQYNGEQTEYHPNGVLKCKIHLVEGEKGELILRTMHDK